MGLATALVDMFDISRFWRGGGQSALMDSGSAALARLTWNRVGTFHGKVRIFRAACQSTVGTIFTIEPLISQFQGSVTTRVFNYEI